MAHAIQNREVLFHINHPFLILSHFISNLVPHPVRNHSDSAEYLVRLQDGGEKRGVPPLIDGNAADGKISRTANMIIDRLEHKVSFYQNLCIILIWRYACSHDSKY